jgi:hypothetical protein
MVKIYARSSVVAIPTAVRERCASRPVFLPDRVCSYAAGRPAHANADKQKAVLALLSSAEWSTRFDSWIGQQADVSDMMVRKYRKQTSQHQKFEVQKSATKIGKDGKRRPLAPLNAIKK